MGQYFGGIVIHVLFMGQSVLQWVRLFVNQYSCGSTVRRFVGQYFYGEPG